MTNELLKGTLGGIWEAMAENRYHWLRNLPDPPGTPVVEMDQKFKVGDKVITTRSATLKEGLHLVVKDVGKEVTGYWKYYAGGVWHRQEDLRGENI